MDDKILEAFTFGKIQECLNIKKKLDEHNISWEEFEVWVNETAKTYIPPTSSQRIPDLPRKALKRLCPKCKASWLRLIEVNHRPQLMVGEGLHSLWFCINCDWEEYSTKDIVEEAKPYIEELNVVYLPMTAKERKRARRLSEGK